MTSFLIAVLVLALIVAVRALQRSKTEQQELQRRLSDVDVDDDGLAFEIRLTDSWGADPAECWQESHRCWVPAGQEVVVQGHRIPGGLIYLGTELSGPPGGYQSVDPALINPTLALGRGAPDFEGRGISYWPSYSTIPPASRAAYLHWLASARSNPQANIGYVFLFFYGLERRVLFDAEGIDEVEREIPMIAKEVQRLIHVYADSRSFEGYANGFLDYITLKYEWKPQESFDPSRQKVSWRMPLGLKLRLGKMAVDGERVPAEWAFSWFCSHPTTSLRTPARRCPEEFRELFLNAYRDKFKNGLSVKPNKARLAIEYRAASAALRGGYRAETPDLPDVERLTGPVKRLCQIADQVQEDLAKYSRWIGRHHERGSLDALALLPPALLRSRLQDEHRAILAPIESRLASEEIALVPVAELVEHWPTQKPNQVRKNEARKMATFLAALGFGIEPDPRYGGPNPGLSEHLAVFRLDRGDQPPSEECGAASLLLHLGAAVASVDEDFTLEEQRLLEAHLEASLDLKEGDRTRLKAHLRWLSASPPDLRGIRKRAADLPEQDRRRLGRFLLGVALADGRLDATELTLLEKIYPSLGLDKSAVHSELHSLIARGEAPATGAVTVISSEPSQEYIIPEEPREPVADTEFVLDRKLVSAIQADSREASIVLQSIFVDDSEEIASAGTDGTPEVRQVGEADGFALLELDAAQADFLRTLLSRREWPRSDLETVARSHGIMPDGAIEIINERSYALWEEPIIEGADPVEINEYLMSDHFEGETLE